ncbi:MAG: DEAD/DEAH box helicase [Candidatus Moraniibacteriota bacterium]
MLLPIEDLRSTIVETIRSNQTTILVGETGSGKTTRLPSYLYESGFSKNGIICITEPRRIAAISVANFVAKTIGKNAVSYQVRFDNTSTYETAVKFMTDGILLREIKSDPLLSKYSVIMLDEAHERSVNIDFLLGLLKKILTLRADLRLVIASATIDAEKFSTYFGSAPVINVESRRHEVAIIWGEKDYWDIKDVVRRCVEKVTEIHERGKSGDILVFLASYEEIHEVSEKLWRAHLTNVVVLPAHGGLLPERLDLIFEKYPGCILFV